ncbi:hypothetical protein V500_10252, partial [Pseudogymnoascus sp. VKM F-4518 (FW-2643)]
MTEEKQTAVLVVEVETQTQPCKSSEAEAVVLIMQAEEPFLLSEVAELQVKRMKGTHLVPLKAHAEIQERHQKTFGVEDSGKESRIALPLEEEEMENLAGESVEKRAERTERTHTVPPKMHAETQERHQKSCEVQESTKERRTVPLMVHIQEQNQPFEATELQEESASETETAALVAQATKKNQPQKASELGDKMEKEVPLFLSKTRTETQMLPGTDDLREKRTKRTRVLQTILPPNPESAELRGKSMEEAEKADSDMLEEENNLNYSADQFWIPRTTESWRAVDSRKGELENPPRKIFEPKVNPATAALRKQYADIQSKISPAKPATPKIRWTPNLPIPPPDGPDLNYAPPEVRSPEGLPKPPRVSEAELRKRKREKERLEKEETLIDEALDTEIPPKPRKRGKRLNELEEAMRVAGMYPEDPDGKAGREKGKGRGR